MAESDSTIKVATLNLNGETYWSINKRPRLPQELFDIMEIRKTLTNLTIEGLIKITNGGYDIIAFQELINSKKEQEQVVEAIEKNGYKLFTPEVDNRTHFTVGFIIKDGAFDKVAIRKNLEKSDNKLPPNRFTILDVEKYETKFAIVNMHVNNHTIDIPSFKTNVILLGDMNACTNLQSSNEEGSNIEFYENILENYKSTGIDTDYTWISNGVERKLDHIFVSETFENYKEISSEKIDSVNFYYEQQQGFTDHSMLVLELAYKKLTDGHSI